MNKKLALIPVAIVLIIAASAFNRSTNYAAANTDCFQVYKTEWGKHCGSDNSFQIYMTNTCNVTMDLMYALKKTDGTWDIGANSSVEPGEDCGYGMWTCTATGRYRWWSRVSGSGDRFPTKDEINQMD